MELLIGAALGAYVVKSDDCARVREIIGGAAGWLANKMRKCSDEFTGGKAGDKEGKAEIK